jgi:hypothetical protein
MTLMSGTLEICVRTLRTDERCRTRRPARLFFMLEVHGQQGAIGHAGACSPHHREAGFGATGHVVLRSPPNGSGASGHMAAPEPTLAGR